MSDDRSEMTPEALDELASAYLDGETTAEETALVESDPRLQALVDEFREVKALVAAPVELPDDEMQDQMIAQALNHQAPVVSLEQARRRRRPIPRQAQVILAAAAVVAAIAIISVTVFQQSDQGDDDMFVADDSAPADTAMEASAPAAIPESADLAEDTADSSAAAAPVPPEEMAEEPEMALEMMAEEPEMAAQEMMADDTGTDDDDAKAASEMDELPVEVEPTVDESYSWYENEEDLFAHAVVIANELDETAPADLMGCPHLPNEGVELLRRFNAHLGYLRFIDTQISLYADNGDLLVTQTSQPPECELLRPIKTLEWVEWSTPSPLPAEGEQP